MPADLMPSCCVQWRSGDQERRAYSGCQVAPLTVSPFTKSIVLLISSLTPTFPCSTVQKLRNQFDTGADIDLSLTDASELDPNAVASVFKAYLRERQSIIAQADPFSSNTDIPLDKSNSVPSPILTAALTPAFDVVLRKYTGSPARDNGFGTSSVARPEGSLKNADEKAALLKEVKELLAQLPEVHWWLIKAVTSLLDHTVSLVASAR